MKKLYHLKVVVDTVVLAENEDDALVVFEDNKKDIFENDFDNFNGFEQFIEVVEIKNKKQLPKNWDTRCLPWKSYEDDAREIGYYLNKKE